MLKTSEPVTVQLQTPSGEKQATLRWPTDDEWAAREKQSPTVIRPEGLHGTVTEVRNPEAAARRLFDAIRQDGDGANFDDFEAREIIAGIGLATVQKAERQGADVLVDLEVAGGGARHILKLPTARERALYHRSTTVLDMGRQGQEIRRDVIALANLWSELVVSTDGYDGEVPLPHKTAALAEAIEVAEQSMGALTFISRAS